MSKSGNITFTLSGERILPKMFMILVGIEIFLVLLDVIVNYGKFTDIGALRRLCNIAREDGVATYFAATQTLFAGLTAMLVYVVSKQMGKAKKETIGWLIIALFFMYMAVDDASQIHERVGTAFKTIADRGDGGLLWSWLHLSPSYSWQVVVLPVFVGVGLYISYFLWVELKAGRSKILVFLALAFMGTAVVLDFIEGLHKDHPLNIYTHIKELYDLRSYTVSHFAKVIEEFLEMLSISTFWIVFSAHFFSLLKEVSIRIESGS